MNQYLLLCFTVICYFFLPSVCDVCNISDAKRIDCGWHGVNQAVCESNGCCWKPASVSGMSYPWCFYDSGIAANLRSAKVCEHTGPAILTCSSTQQINIHDVFYGRNADDNSCHNSGSLTCYNPNATQTVKEICKASATCSVSSKGDIWNFNPTCDGLNAQLRIHYLCIARESSLLPTSSFMTSSVFDLSTSNSVMVQSSQSVSASTDMSVSSLSFSDRTSSSTPESYAMSPSLNLPGETKAASSSTLGPQSSPSSAGKAEFTAVLSKSFSVTKSIILSEAPSSEVTPILAPTVTNRTTIPEMTSTLSSFSPVEYMSLTSKYTNASSTATTATIKTIATSMTSRMIMPHFTATISESFEASGTPIIESSTPEVVAPTTVNNTEQTTQTTHVVESLILPSSTIASSESLYTVLSSKHSLSASTIALSQAMKTSTRWSAATSHNLKASSSMTKKPSVSATTSRASPSKSKTVQLTSKSKIVSTLVSKSHSQTPKTKVVTPTPSTKLLPSSSVKPTVVKPGTANKNKGKFTKVEYILFGVGGLVILILLVVLIYCFKKKSPYKHDVLTDDLPAAPSGIYYAADVPMEEIPHSSVRHIATRRLDGSYDNTGLERDEADDVYDPESDRIHIRR